MDALNASLPVHASALLAFGAVVLVRRREALALRWRPDRHVAAALGTGLLAVAFSAAILLFPERSAPGLALLFAVGLLYHAVFQLTRNLLWIWPFFFFGGVWNDFALTLDFPARIGEAPGWVTVGLAILLCAPLLLRPRAGSA